MKSFLLSWTLVKALTCAEVISNEVLFQRNEAKHLTNHVIKKHMGVNEMECGILCERESFCASANYKISDQYQGTCELNTNTLQNGKKNVLQDPEFVNLEIVERVSISIFLLNHLSGSFPGVHLFTSKIVWRETE